MRSDGRVDREQRAKFRGELLHGRIVPSGLLHDDVGHRDLEPARDHEADSGERALERALDLGYRVVNLGAMGVDADLNRVHAEFADQRGFFFPDQDPVSLEFHIEGQLARAPQDRKNIAAQHRLAAAYSQKEDSRRRHLRHQVFDLFVAHFAQVIVIEVAMDAALVAAPGNVEVNAERDAELDRLGVEVLEDSAHARSCPMGWSASRRIPSCASCSTSSTASRYAVSASISNSDTRARATISRSGVAPSAALQMSVALGFRLKTLESLTDMMTISSTITRAAMSRLGLM